MKPIIRVRNLNKQYRIGTRRASYMTLKETVAGALRSPFSRGTRRNADLSGERVWALKDVSFDVMPGEVVGVIGRNGAGKSTLLKVLSRITEPTEGRVELYGRVGSLLEVGTGFHPELTGRENVYLNGAILGMGRREIDRKFDEIVAFAEIEKFIDTPVKHYSSGMYMRLAFAVAAHLEPEILIVDEVLAVGDAAFQKKCLGKMGDVARQGRTVLFVSHNMGAVSRLCDRAILLACGGVEIDGNTGEAIDKYVSETKGNIGDTPLSRRHDRDGDGRIRFTDLHWETIQGETVSVLRSGGDYNLVLTYECPDGLSKHDVVVSFGVKDHLTGFLMLHRTDFNNENFNGVPPRGSFVCRIPKFPLTAGEYLVNIFVGIEERACDSVEDASKLTVEYGDFFGTNHPGIPSLCKVLIDCEWGLQRP
jgi:lipopolysaccharide transport system ATP-binding protein